MDISLPGGSGLEIIREVKKQGIESGIIIVSAKNSLEDRIEGLEIGSDDYLTKPFHLPELNARLKSILRRRNFQGSNEIIFNELRILPESRQVFVNDHELILTGKEFDLLVFFVANKGKVLSKDSIAEHLWGDHMDQTDSFDFLYPHIKNVRKKLLQLVAKDYL